MSTILNTRIASPAERIAELTRRIAAKNPMQERYMDSALAQLAAGERAELANYIEHALESGATLDALADSYLTIVADTLREQLNFRRTGTYRHSTFAEVADAVYHDGDYMSRYMHGLALTAFFWTNHLELKRFFTKSLPRDKGGDYLEIGPGHGFFLVSAMRASGYTRFTGVDLSASSIALTRAIVQSPRFGATDKPVELKQADFFTLEGGRYDAVVAGEVLEHVEQPEKMLSKIADMAREGAFVFVTTCFNSPAVDHIYLYEDKDQLFSQIKDAGLTVTDSLLVPHPGRTVDECMSDKLPVNIAVAARK